MPDIFNTNIPLAEKLRPSNLAEVVGQDHLLAKSRFLYVLANKKELISLIFWGPSGVGKTTIAKLLAKECGYEFVSISAMFTSISEIKIILEDATRQLSYGQKIVLFVDEIHRLNIKQQDIFLPDLEKGTIILLGATTENPSFYLNKALLSRCQVVELNMLEREHFILLKKRAEKFLNKKFEFKKEVLNYIIEVSNGDGRYFLSILETLSLLEGLANLSLEDAKNFIRKRAAIYDKNKDAHYNLISALHKSIRGSDPQASLYWFSRMVEGGEDLNYVARRLLRTAAEDIGLADPNAVTLVINAWQGYERLGSPEGEILLAEVVVYLALAPKSNSIYMASKTALALAKKTSGVLPPKHILNAPTTLMKDLDYGKNYIYDHNTKHGFSAQNYFPEKLPRENFYVPKEVGFERELKKRMDYFSNLRNKLGRNRGEEEQNE